MNINRTVSALILGISLFALGIPAHAQRPDNPGGGRGGGNDSGNLQATFCLTIYDPEPDSNYVRTDGGGPTPPVYCDEEQVVQVSTGSGPGFRWDTNLQNSLKATRKFGTARWVYMNILDDSMALDLREIDFRFHRDPGLDLGSLVPLDEGVYPNICETGVCTGNVLAWLRYQTEPGVVNADDFDETDWGILAFGALEGQINETAQGDDTHDLARTCLLDAAPGIKVTRTHADTWILESNPLTGSLACRFALVGNGGAECTNTHACTFDEDDRIRFEFKFTLVQEPE